MPAQPAQYRRRRLVRPRPPGGRDRPHQTRLTPRSGISIVYTRCTHRHPSIFAYPSTSGRQRLDRSPARPIRVPSLGRPSPRPTATVIHRSTAHSTSFPLSEVRVRPSGGNPDRRNSHRHGLVSGLSNPETLPERTLTKAAWTQLFRRARVSLGFRVRVLSPRGVLAPRTRASAERIFPGAFVVNPGHIGTPDSTSPQHRRPLPPFPAPRAGHAGPSRCRRQNGHVT